MVRPAATVDATGGAMDPHDTGPYPAPRDQSGSGFQTPSLTTSHVLADPPTRGGTMKFTYPSGHRPLDGYTIRRGVGIGGFGEVYFATSDAGKEVALKRIQRNFEVELRGVSQCLNLKHPNLLDLYDIRYDDAGQSWVVMEFIHGESLKDALDRCPNGMPVAEARRWFDSIAAGVEYLHDHGIVHRDLKPGNVFSDEGVVKIGDYGLSKFISTSHRSGHTESVGTFHYMAPEIGKGNYGRQIDIYALGVVLFELLTGRVPFEGESTQEIIMKHLTAEPDLSIVPAVFRPVIAKALAKDPAERYALASEMAAEFRDAVDGTSNSRASAEIATNESLGSNNRGSNSPNEPAIRFVDSSANQTPRQPEMVFGPVKNGPAPGVNGHVNGQASVAPAKGHPQPPGAIPPRRTAFASYGAAAPTMAPAPSYAQPQTTRSAANAATSLMSRPFSGEWSHPWSGLSPMLGVFAILAGLLALGTIEWPSSLAVVIAEGVGLAWLASRTRIARRSRGVDPFRAEPPRTVDELLRSQIREKGPRERSVELLASVVWGAGICGLASAALYFVFGGLSDPLFGPRLAWLIAVSTAATASVLVLSKRWEGQTRSNWSRRLTLGIVGMGVGAFAFALESWLLLAPAPGTESTLGELHDDKSHGLLVALFFVVALAAPRWWLYADPARRHMTAYWLVGAIAIGSWMLQLALMGPNGWTWLAPVVASLAVQASAPWFNRDKRQQALAAIRRR